MLKAQRAAQAEPGGGRAGHEQASKRAAGFGRAAAQLRPSRRGRSSKAMGPRPGLTL